MNEAEISLTAVVVPVGAKRMQVSRALPLLRTVRSEEPPVAELSVSPGLVAGIVAADKVAAGEVTAAKLDKSPFWRC